MTSGEGEPITSSGLSNECSTLVFFPAFLLLLLELLAKELEMRYFFLVALLIGVNLSDFYPLGGLFCRSDQGRFFLREAILEVERR